MAKESDYFPKFIVFFFLYILELNRQIISYTYVYTYIVCMYSMIHEKYFSKYFIVFIKMLFLLYRFLVSVFYLRALQHFLQKYVFFLLDKLNQMFILQFFFFKLKVFFTIYNPYIFNDFPCLPNCLISHKKKYFYV